MFCRFRLIGWWINYTYNTETNNYILFLFFISADADLKQTHVSLQVKHTGSVFYAPHAVYKSGCLVDLTNYPYDIQSCDLWIQSASRYSWDLELVPYKPISLDLDTYLGSFKDAKVHECLLFNYIN